MRDPGRARRCETAGSAQELVIGKCLLGIGDYWLLYFSGSDSIMMLEPPGGG